MFRLAESNLDSTFMFEPFCGYRKELIVPIDEKWLQQKFFGIIPKGWFVLKDILFGWICWKIEERLLRENNNGSGIVIMLDRK